MRYLVTGGAGYLGLHLVELLLQENHEVTVIDDFSNGHSSRLSGDVNLIEGDIGLPSTFAKISAQQSFDGIFHLAARKSVAESFIAEQAYYEVNVGGTQNLMDFCVERNIKNFVFTSTAAVYSPSHDHETLRPDSFCKASNPYGATKIEAENLIESYVNRRQIRGVSLRCFNLAGCTKEIFFDFNGENVIPVLLKSIKSNSTFLLFGDDFDTPDGSAVRDYIHVADAARAHLFAMKKMETQDVDNFLRLNVASGFGVSLKQLIANFEAVSDSRVEVRIDARRVGDLASVVGSNHETFRQLGWKPEKAFSDIVEDTWRAYIFKHDNF